MKLTVNTKPMTIETDTDLVFDVCDQVINSYQQTTDLFNDYMYMYSIDNQHYFNHKETREYISVVARIN